MTISYEPCTLGWEDNQTLSTNEASRGCSPCDTGSYRDTQSLVACQSCSSGRYAAHPGAITCDICADGTYADATGFVTCSVCELPALVNAGRTSCEICDAGLGNIGGVCGGCPFGSAPISGRCACLAGYYSTATASNDVPNCMECPEGIPHNSLRICNRISAVASLIHRCIMPIGYHDRYVTSAGRLVAI